MRALLLVLMLMPLAGCLDGDAEPDVTPEATKANPELVSKVAPQSYSVFPGNYRFNGTLGGSVPLEPGWFGITDVASVVLTSALDGADIDLSFWRPTKSHETDEPGPVPVIIQASPYFSRTDAPSGSQNFGQWMHDVFVPNGYAYAQLAIRSTGSSGGCDDFRGPKMTADMVQAIDWIIDQDWASDAVALIGKSYPGSTPWYAAGSGHPAIKTIVPTSGSTNAWEVYLRNGTPESRAAAIVPTYGATAASNAERSPEHKAENFLCTEVYESWVNGVSSGVSGERITAEWWQERNSKPSVEANYRGSIFLVHGLQDWNVDPAVAIPWTQHLADSGNEVKQWLGQWAHDWPDQGSPETRRWDFAEVLLRWFDRELKGLDVDVGPPVQVQSNDGRWRDELAWPPKDADHRTLYLGNGILADEEQPHDVLEFNPATAADPHTFRILLEEDTRIAGLPLVHVTVTPDGPGGYMGAILYSESPSGERTRLGWTGMNFRYADGTETPQNVLPQFDLVLKMQLQPFDAFIPAGHTLALDLGFITPSDRIQPPHPYPYSLHWGPGYVGEVVLPIVERGEAAFFQPPMP